MVQTNRADGTSQSVTSSHHDHMAEARARIDEIATLYEEIRCLVVQMLEATQPLTLGATKSALSKISELQTAHLLVLQAEEKFHAKFAEDDTGPATDYDRIRADIGGALARIRAASGSGAVSEDPDT